MTDTSQITVLGSVSFGWLHQHGNFRFDEPFFMNPRLRTAQERQIQEFVATRFPDEPIYNIEAHLVQTEGRRKPVILVGGLQPNLILGAAVGAQIVFAPDKDPDITPTPLADVTRIEKLCRMNWSDTWPVNLFLDQIAELRNEPGNDVAIIPPFFWDTTGRATTHGILTTAQKLIGERIFLEFTDHPGFAHDLFSWIVDAYATLIRLFADAAGLQITSLHTGDCSACMMGPDQYAEFVLPHLNELVSRVGPVRLHSCGPSDHLLDVFSQVDNLASLNVSGDTSVARIRQRFGQTRIDISPELHMLASGRPDEIDAWVRTCVEENGTGRLEFQYHLDVGYPEANCLQIHHTLEQLGYPSAREAIY